MNNTKNWFKWSVAAVLLLSSPAVFAQQKLGDNLGTHKASKTLNMDGNDVDNVRVLNSEGVVIGTASAVSNTSVALQVNGSNKAILLPRVTDLLNPTTPSIVNPLEGMIVYDLATRKFYLRDNNAWVTYATTSLAEGKILVGDSNNTPQPVTMAGDATLSSAGVITIGADKITTVKILNGNVTNEKLATDAVTEEKILDLAVTARKIGAGSGNNKVLTTDNTGANVWVDRSKFASTDLTSGQILLGNASDIATAVAPTGDVTIDNTGVTTIGADKVTTAKILNENVTTAKLAADAVTTVKIADQNVTTGKIADLNVTEGKLAADAVTTVKIADLNVTTGKIADLGVTEGKIAADAVTTTKILNGAVTAVKVGSGAGNDKVLTTDNTGANVWVDRSKFASTDLNSGQILLGNASNVATAVAPTGDVTIDNTGVTTIGADKVTTAKILDANVTTAKIADLNVTTDKLAADAVTTVKILDANVTTAKIADLNVTTDKLAADAVTTVKILDANVTTGKIADLNVTTDKLAANAVTTAKITDLNVTTDKLAADAVTTAKILDANVTTGKIADLNVTTDKLAANAVTTAKITDLNVTTDKLAASAVTTAKINDLAVTAAKVGSGSGNDKVLTTDNTGANVWVDRSKFASTDLNSGQILLGNASNEAIAVAPTGDVTIDNTGVTTIGADKVTTAKILNANVTTAKIADLNVTTDKLAADAVTTAKILNANVTTAKIADLNVTTDKLAADAVTTVKILDANVTTGKIADLNVTTDKLAANAVTTAKITDLNVTTDKLAADAVTTAKILDANVTTGKIADLNVTTDKLAANAVTTAKITDLNVTTDKLAASAVTTAKINDLAVTAAKVGSGSGNDKVLTTNNTGDNVWVDRSKFASTDLNSGQILLGNATNVATAVAPTGDVTIDNTGVTTIGADKVTTAKILNANVTTAKIADLNVTTDKLAADAVTTAKILNSNVTTAKIADLNVTTDKLAADAVTTVKILDANVTTGKIADLNVTTDKLAANAVTTAKITDLNVTTDKLAASAVTTAKINDLAVTAAKVGSGSGNDKVLTTNNTGDNVWVDRSKFASTDLNSGQILLGNATNVATAVAPTGDVTISNSGVTTIGADKVTTAKILNENVTTAKLAADAVTTVKILDANVTTGKIADLNVTTDKLAADAVTTAKILDANVTNGKLSADAVTSDKIKDGEVKTGDLADLNVTTVKLANNAVTSAKLSSSTTTDADRAVSTDHIKDKAVTVAKIANGTANQVLTTNAAGTGVEWVSGSGKYVDLVNKQDNINGLKTFVSDSGFVAKGTFGTGAIPATGAGARMMWYPKKAAFRVGQSTGSQWDDSLTGNYSIAGGLSSMAGGYAAVSIGNATSASGNYSVALGHTAFSSGNNSFALGSYVSTNSLAGSFILGDYQPTITNSVNSTKNDVANQMAMRFTGGFKFGTTINTTTGVITEGLTLGSNGVAKYMNDYSANYDARSLVDKAYVDKLAPSLLSGQVIVGNSANTAAAVTLTGDVTISNTGVTTIGADKVITSKILDQNVTTAKIADLNVTTGKIADLNVTTAKIADLNVTNGKLEADAITTDKIKDGEVKSADIASDASVDANRAITTTHIRDKAITVAKIANGTANQVLVTNSAGTAATWTTASGIYVDLVSNQTVNGVKTFSSTGGLVATGTFGSGTIPATGAGTRTMWYPKKAAFRTGVVDGTQWDDINVGLYSFAVGSNPIASGFQSIAMGYNAISSGYGSLALGQNTSSTGQNTLALGESTTASGAYTTAMGRNVSTNSKDGSFIIGDNIAGTANSAVTLSSLPNQMTTRFANGYRFGTTADAAGVISAGVTIDPNGIASYITDVTASLTDSKMLVNKAYVDASKVLGNGQILVGNSTNVATAVTPTGDVTISNTGVTTIGTDKVTTAKIIDLAVTTGKLANNAVTDAKLSSSTTVNADRAVGTDHIKDNAVTVAKIAPGTANQILTTSAGGVTQWASGSGRYVDRVSDQTIKGVKTFTSDTAFVATGTYAPANAAIVTPVIGNGTRMMWYAKKAAFRAGMAVSTQWNDANIGNYSMGLGFGVQANGDNSVALGSFVNTNGKQGSFAFGDFTSSQTLANDVNNQMAMRFTGGYKFFVNDNSTVGLALTATTGVAKYLADYSADYDARSLVDKAYVDKKAPALTSGQIIVGNSLNTAAAVTATGDVTIDNTGLTTIGADKVTTVKILDANVTNAKLAADAITTDKIKDGEVKSADIASDASVDANRAITTNHVKDKAVTVAKIANGTANQILATNAGATAASWINGNGLFVDLTTNQTVNGVKTFADNGGMVATGTFGTGTIPVTGAGSRMMWYPAKSAFRAGTVASTYGTFWDDATTGAYSVSMGRNTYGAGEASISMGDFAKSYGTNGVALGKNVTAGGNNSVVLGTAASTFTSSSDDASGKNGSFVFADASTATYTRSSADNQMMMRFAGGYRFYTSSDLSSYVDIAPGANGMSITSDRRRKENFEAVNGELFLQKIDTLKLSSWNYKKQDPKKFRHYGPMAQDFYHAFGKDGFGTIGNDTTISSSDFDGVNMIAIQGLVKRTNDLKKENEALKAEIEALKSQNGRLTESLEQQKESNTATAASVKLMDDRLKQMEMLIRKSNASDTGSGNSNVTASKE